MSLSNKALEDAQGLMALRKDNPTSERATKLKSDWNSFVDWLDKKGVKGNPDLDAGVGNDNVGIRFVRQYQQENPNTLISPETIKEVQGHFQNYRDYTIDQLRNKKIMLSDSKTPKGRYVTPDENLDFYMKDLSKVDGIPGQRTTKWKFPNEFLTTIYKAPDGKVEKSETINKGLAKN